MMDEPALTRRATLAAFGLSLFKRNAGPAIASE
jgi:hypothetical protein